MTDPKLSLFYIGYKAKGCVGSYNPSYIFCRNLTNEQQKKLIEWFNKELYPLIDRALEELN